MHRDRLKQIALVCSLNCILPLLFGFAQMIPSKTELNAQKSTAEYIEKADRAADLPKSQAYYLAQATDYIAVAQHMHDRRTNYRTISLSIGIILLAVSTAIYLYLCPRAKGTIE